MDNGNVKKVGYGIYNPFKNLKIAKRLPGLQNILQAKMMAIHHTHTYQPTTGTDSCLLKIMSMSCKVVLHLTPLP